jgi:hypothetical protein
LRKTRRDGGRVKDALIERAADFVNSLSSESQANEDFSLRGIRIP